VSATFVGVAGSRRSVDLWQRLARLYAGLAAFGLSIALMVKARLGLGPWDVLHQGLADRLAVEIGWIVIGVGALALLAWIPLHERPGIGTLSNVIVIGLVVNAALATIPSPNALPARWLLLVLGIVLNGLATGLYIGAGLGPGPRDGLMTGLARRGHSVRAARTVIEVAVLAVGFALGGSVGPGTIAYAVGIGPLAHCFLPRLALPSRNSRNQAQPGHRPYEEG
jgi:uncharacterized membrane protein YczE